MRTSMNPPPPMFPAWGSTTASANATATAASTAFPPRFMISTPASDASFSSLTTIPFGSRRDLAGHSGSVSRAAVAVYSRGCVLFRDGACGCAATAVEERVKIANSAMSFVIEEDFRGLGRARQLRRVRAYGTCARRNRRKQSEHKITDFVSSRNSPILCFHVVAGISTRRLYRVDVICVGVPQSREADFDRIGNRDPWPAKNQSAGLRMPALVGSAIQHTAATGIDPSFLRCSRR